jgi:hypothetical protein
MEPKRDVKGEIVTRDWFGFPNSPKTRIDGDEYGVMIQMRHVNHVGT